MSHGFICTCGANLIKGKDGWFCPTQQLEEENSNGLKGVYDWSKFFNINLSNTDGWDLENVSLLDIIDMHTFIRLAKNSRYNGILPE